MAIGRKQISFDLDTKALKLYYPNKSWNNAYEDIKRHMKKNGFSWLQGSVYVSDRPISAAISSNIITSLIESQSWLNACMRDCRQSNISKEHSQNHLFDKDADIPQRDNVKRSS